jgi:hypothetical protein
MLTVIWEVDDFHIVDLMIPQRCFDSQYFMDNTMIPLVDKVFSKWRNLDAHRLHLHLDNCRVHFSKVNEQFIAQIIFRMFRNHRTIPFLHRRISGFLVV